MSKILPLVSTDEMRQAMEGETPYFCRRALDKSCYVVGIRKNVDWADVISDDQEILETFPHEDLAHDKYGELEFQWRYAEMLRVAPTLPNPLLANCWEFNTEYDKNNEPSQIKATFRVTTLVDQGLQEKAQEHINAFIANAITKGNAT